MARCEICGKHTLSGNSISHSHFKTRRKWQPNLQKIRAIINGKIKRIKVCAKCIKTGKVIKAV